MFEPEGMTTNLLLTCDKDYRYKYHSRKLMGKLRQLLKKENSWLFYNEYKPDDHRHANHASFIIHSLLF